MRNYGYEIVQTLNVDIEPDETVKRAMNEINASEETHVSLLCPFIPCSSSMLNRLLFKIYFLMQIDVNLVVDTNQQREMVFFSKSSFSWPELSWMNLQFCRLWRSVNQINALFLDCSYKVEGGYSRESRGRENSSGEASRGGGRGKVSFRSGCCTSASSNCWWLAGKCFSLLRQCSRDNT